VKAATLARLDLLAADREAKLLETIRQQNAAMQQAAYQRDMLASYRERLAESWQGGAVVSAAQARRAGQFAAGALGAETQIVETEARAKAKLEAAVADLARLKAHRRKLGERLREVRRRAQAAAELKAAQDLPLRRPVSDVS
jgi:flagellar biosynthesis chaperone FliJ